MTFDNPLRTAAAVLVGLGVALPSASDAAFTQTKPSQILTVRYSGAPCTALPESARIDSLVNPADGSLSPFIVPNGQVFVITDATFGFFGIAGDYTVTINALPPGSLNNFVPITNAPFTIAPADGGGTVHVGQAVLKPGMELCFSTNSGNLVNPDLRNSVRGFLTDDK